MPAPPLSLILTPVSATSVPSAAEHPQPTVAVAAEDDRLPIADKRLDAPEVVAARVWAGSVRVRVNMAADLDQTGRGVTLRVACA